MTSVLRSLTHPVRSWRGLGTAGKFLVYSRWSLELLAVAMPLVLLVPALSLPAVTPGVAAVTILVLLCAALLAVVSLELQPEFNLGHRPGHRRVFRTGIALHATVMVVCLALAHLPVADPVKLAAVFVFSGLSLILFLAYLAFVPHRWWWAVGLAVIQLAVLWEPLGAVPSSVVSLGVLPLFLTSMTALTAWTAGLMLESDRARRLESELKVSEERLRFAQQLHDTLGQHLAAMSLKAELAQKLADRGDARVRGELADLRKLAATSMAQMREVVHGYRSINLATEAEGARSLLLDAGIPLTVTGDSLEVPARHRETAAWFVREATTNILRHAAATQASLTLTPGRVTMTNDGAHGDVGKPGGLDTLRQRGAQVAVSRDADLFTVEMTMDVLT